MATSSLSLVKRQQVLGALKATGSRDPDVLFATKEALLDPVRPLRIIGLWGYVAGGLATALVLTAFLGIPLIVFSWWMRRRGKRNPPTGGPDPAHPGDRGRRAEGKCRDPARDRAHRQDEARVERPGPRPPRQVRHRPRRASAERRFSREDRRHRGRRGPGRDLCRMSEERLCRDERTRQP